MFSHPWLRGLNPEELYMKKLPAPFTPELTDEMDTKYFSAKQDFTTTIIP